MAKLGDAMSSEELATVTTRSLLGRITKFIRCDFGGVKGDDKLRVVLKRAANESEPFRELMGRLSAEDQMIVAGGMIHCAAGMCESSRKRLSSTVGELRRRLLTPEEVGADMAAEMAEFREEDRKILNLKF